MDTSARDTQKNPIEALSKDEIISKYKGLLGIAKKAKQAKDELTEENRQLKDALAKAISDHNSQSAMQEMLQEFTDKNLKLTEQVNSLQRRTKEDSERLSQFEIENESLRRQLGRLSDENDDLLADVERMEQAMQQVNSLGNEQRKNLELLEDDIAKIKDAEIENDALRQQVESATEETKLRVAELAELQQKYENVKQINSEQRKKFNALKDRFIDVHRKLKSLKECKCVLLETQHEYAASVSKWQKEIIKASQLLCAKMTTLQKENTHLKEQLEAAKRSTDQMPYPNKRLLQKVYELEALAKLIKEQQKQQQPPQPQVEQQKHEEHQQQPKIELNVNGLLDKLNKAEQLVNIVKEQQHSLPESIIDVGHFTAKLNQMQQLTQILQEERSEQQSLEQKFQRETALLEANCVELRQHNKDLQTRYQLKEHEQVEQQKHEEHQQQPKIEVNVNGLLDKLNRAEQLVNIVKEQQDSLPESIIDVGHFTAKLNQMQQLTQILQKERSEQQSNQQSLEQKFERETALLEANCVELRQHNEDLQTRYQLKEHEHAELLAEMRELNEALKARGDVISRMQEQHDKSHKELKDLTENLDERTKQMELLQVRVDELEQHEQMNGDAQSDVLSTSTISRAEELSRLRELDDGYEEKYNKLRALAAKLKKKLQEQTQQIKNMEQAGATKLEAELETIKLAQTQLQQDLNAARAENQKLKSKDKSKSSNVLNLEIEAAEKSLNEVSAKLLAKSSELDALKETLVSKENTITQLRQEISILEEGQRGEAAHSKQLKQQIDLMQAQIKDAVHAKQQALNENKELEQNVEQQKLQVEQMRLQLADNTQQYEAKIKNSEQLQSKCAQELEMRVEKLTQVETDLRQAQRIKEELQAEFMEYKVKAQSVLRKQQNRDTDKEQELETELNTLRVTEQQLRAANDERAQQIVKLEAHVVELQRDNTQLMRRSQELTSLIDELHDQVDALTQDNQRQLQQHQQQLQQHRHQIEQLDSVNQMQTVQLQQKIDQLEKAAAAANVNAVVNSNPAVPRADVITSPEQTKIDYLLDHDGNAGETLAQLAAQRKISTASRRSHDFMPLDELLNTSLNAINSDSVTTISHFGRSVSIADDNISELDARAEAQAALAATKERLTIQESRVRHLTTLLAENEQDLAKLTQMNDMLKEELRRQERSEEREQHMHNSEYLKNVFLKFITLSNTDERQRLVPVLNTILRLSRSEMEMLNCVAKGQKVSNDGNNRSWTGFLSAWSGGGGGGNTANNNTN